MQGFYRLFSLAGVGLVACGSPTSTTGGTPSPGSGGTQTGVAGTATTPTAGNGPAGGAATGGSISTGGGSGAGTAGNDTAAGKASTAGAGGTSGGTSGGSGGTSGGGSAGSTPVAGSGGSGSASDPSCAPPTHALNVQAAPGEHLHQNVAGVGNNAAFGNAVPMVMGKLIIDVEVDQGGIYKYGYKHGFHVLGPSIFHCNIAQAQSTYTSMGKDFNGDCRLETFDGVDHDTSTATGHAMVAPADSVTGKVKAALADLQQKYPEEDWGYFLGADGSVRWCDVGLTGYSHGASSSVRWAKVVNVWRVVARSGPRDNLCGTLYSGKTCMEDVISSWLDEPSKTPVANLWGLTGTTDSEYGDIIFAMERMKFVGTPTDLSTTPAPYNGSHRLIVNGKTFTNEDHPDFNNVKYWPAMDVAWSVPQANIDYANAHPM